MAGFFTVTDWAEACPGEGESEKVKGARKRIIHNAFYPDSTFLIIFDITKNKLVAIYTYTKHKLKYKNILY